MADHGIKILKVDKDASSTNIDDYIFWSKYQSLPFLYKTTFDVTIAANTTTKTEIYTHNLGFFPFVIAFAGTRMLPISETGGYYKYCCAGAGTGVLQETVTCKITDTTAEVTATWGCFIPMFGACDPPNVPITYSISLYFYMFELGSAML